MPEPIDRSSMAAWTSLLARAATQPINIDISSFSDEWCGGFLAGQESVLEEIQAGRLELPEADRD